ncbi:MAG: helix-turn-helix transcriptional regulator [Candidatus Omnitrophota bacterium]
MNNRALSEFGQRIRQLRKVRGLTQGRLAVKAGLHYTYVGSVERGEKNISLISIKNLARALEVEVCELFLISNPIRIKKYSLVEEVTSYLKTRSLDEIERARRILYIALEK